MRSQVPLLRASVAVTNSSEQMIRVKLLEQENERYVRKIKGLESQLSELERVSLIATFESPFCTVVMRFDVSSFVPPPNMPLSLDTHTHGVTERVLVH